MNARPPIYGHNTTVKVSPERFRVESCGLSFEVRDYDGHPIAAEDTAQEAGIIAEDLNDAAAIGGRSLETAIAAL